jgi:N-dimethylarginine dimethylaminohydrolase
MAKLNRDGKNEMGKLLNTLMKESRSLWKEKSKLNGVLWSIYGHCQCAISNIEDHKALAIIEMISKQCEDIIYDKNGSTS